MRAKMTTPATWCALRTIIDREFAGSQAAFSQAADLDTADTSRVLTGVRPASVEIVSRALGALEDPAASQLIEAFLSDLTTAFPKAYSINVQPRHAMPAESPGKPGPTSPLIHAHSL